MDYVGERHGNVRLPGVMMLGYVAAHSENLAMSVIVSKVMSSLSAPWLVQLVDCQPPVWKVGFHSLAGPTVRVFK